VDERAQGWCTKYITQMARLSLSFEGLSEGGSGRARAMMDGVFALAWSVRWQSEVLLVDAAGQWRDNCEV
jgi:hypothetical protein